MATASEEPEPEVPVEPAASRKNWLLLALVILLAVALFLILSPTTQIAGGKIEFVGIGHAFDGSTLLPKEDIQKAFNEARDSMVASADSSRTLGIVQTILQWVGFAFGAVVTVVAGYHWQSDASSMKLADLKKAFGRKANTLRFVGVLSALATVITVAAAKVGEHSLSLYDRAKLTQSKLNAAVSDMKKAKNAEEAQAVLDELRIRR